ncbi:MAG: CBS domain-containing protein [Thermoplasmata archaeon]
MSGTLSSDLLRPYLVEDVMTTHVHSAWPDESLLSAAQTMRTHHISGVPVVDQQKRVIGVLSEKDIVAALDRQVGIGHARGILDILLASYEPKRKDLVQRSVAALLNSNVKKAMSHPAVTVEADASLGEAWRLLGRYSVNRLPVVRNETLVGILTRQDVLRMFETKPPLVARVVPRAVRRKAVIPS